MHSYLETLETFNNYIPINSDMICNVQVLVEGANKFIWFLFVLFDLILYVHSTIFQLCGTCLPGLNQY